MHQQITFAETSILIGSGEAGLAGHNADATMLICDPGESPFHFIIGVGEVETVTISNFGTSIVMEAGPRIFRNVAKKVTLPCRLRVGETHIQIQLADAKCELDEAIKSVAADGFMAIADSSQQVSPNAQTVSAWFEAIGGLNQSVAGSEEFFNSAARAMFSPGGLDGGMILRPVEGSDEKWEVTSSYLPYPEYSIAFREDLVRRCANERTTLYHDSEHPRLEEINDDVQGVIVCPIFGSDNSVVGVMYGFRNQHRTNNRRGIRLLEMKFIQLIASSISTALVRIDRESEAARNRVLLEQAFSPKVAQQLSSGQELLAGRNQEVTVLFADLRGFTSISEQVGTELTYTILTEVMDALSSVIAEEDGVIIDFYGDGLSAFWNAPLPQERHQQMACRAARKIVSALEPISRRWQPTTGQPLRVGVGIHCGTAQVGNSGSSSRLKFGPQGPTVNLTSRLENATKDVGVSIALSGAMVDAIEQSGSHEFLFRRICQTRLAGSRQVTDLYELVRDARVNQSLLTTYESALSLFEESRFSEAVASLTRMQIEHEMDLATEFLLRQSLARSKSIAKADRRASSSDKGKVVALTKLDVQNDRASRATATATSEESKPSKNSKDYGVGDSEQRQRSPVQLPSRNQ